MSAFISRSNFQLRFWNKLCCRYINLQADDIIANLTFDQKTGRPGGVLVFHASLYFPPKYLAVVEMEAVNNEHKYAIMKAGRNLVCGMRMKDALNMVSSL